MHRSFTRTPRSQYEQPEPVTFDLDGEKFTCREALDAAAMYELGRRDLPATVAAVSFVKLCLVDDDEAARFEAALYAGRDESVVDEELLREIVRHVVGSLTARPTMRSSGSAGGPPTTTDTSTDGSGSATSSVPSTSPAPST